MLLYGGADDIILWSLVRVITIRTHLSARSPSISGPSAFRPVMDKPAYFWATLYGYAEMTLCSMEQRAATAEVSMLS